MRDPSLPRIGIGMDSCLIPLRHAGLYLAQTTDFFYPLVDDPYLMGKIACANVLSDLYAMGVTECDNILMILAASQKFSAKEREVVLPMMIRGFRDCAAEAGTSVNGGQSVVNPWVTIGGTASTVVRLEDVIMPNNAQVGDVLVLTKPLGTQVAVNAHQWLVTKPDRIEELRLIASPRAIEYAYHRAMHSMARLNQNAAKLMHKYGAHAATDVTGFGILGHAENLAEHQQLPVSFVIESLPIIANMTAVARLYQNFGLLKGTSAETSGGLLICLPPDKAKDFVEELQIIDGQPAWIIGAVVAGDRTARFVEDPNIIEVPAKDSAQSLW